MNYLKSLTKKQWLTILCVVAFFLIAYFVFFRRPPAQPKNQAIVELENLMRQGTAPVPAVDERLSKKELETLIKQGTAPAPSVSGSSIGQQNGGQPSNGLSKEDKAALLKLMSAPKK